MATDLCVDMVERCGMRRQYSPIDPAERVQCRWRASRTLTLGATGIVVVIAVVALLLLLLLSSSGSMEARHAGQGARLFSPGRSSTVFSSKGDVHGANSNNTKQHSNILGVRVTNKYAPMTQQDLRLYSWTHVAEPHRAAVMEVVGSWSDESLEDGFNFRWEVEGSVVGVGTSVEKTFQSQRRYKCSVTKFYAQPPAVKPDGEQKSFISTKPGYGSRETSIAVDTVEFEVTVKYIRREIRSLTDRDREIFFNAVSILQRVPSAVGREIYGTKFYSKDYFNRLHLHYGGQKECDHWHDGPGFVTSHIAVSLMFEQALQAINPSIALPYWDFTIEGTFYDWSNFRESSVFSDDWFGDAAPRNVGMTPDRGRFGYVPTMTNASEYSDLYNAYELLRSPWNTDPYPFLTRHDHLFGYANNRKPSGCKQYRDAIRKQSWMTLSESMNAAAHGHIHELMGGTWSSEWSGFDNRTMEIIAPFLHTIVPLMKLLWRVDYLQCPSSCDPGVSPDKCHCTCQASAMPGKTPSQVLEAAGVMASSAAAFFYDKDLNLIEPIADEQGHAFSPIPGYTVEETDDIYAEMLRVLCTPMKIGTHYEATSTNDLTFWVLHTTFDRLWHLRRLQNDPSFDETWRDDHTCYGHNPTDLQPFHSLFMGEEEEGPGKRVGSSGHKLAGAGVEVPKTYYTNEMLYGLLRPDGMSIPYLYDNFEWTHCEEKGIIMHGSSAGPS